MSSSLDAATGDQDGISITNPTDPSDTKLVPIGGHSGLPLAVGNVGGKPLVATIAKDGWSSVIVDPANRIEALAIPRDSVHPPVRVQLIGPAIEP